jgi:hypothetical protein
LTLTANAAFAEPGQPSGGLTVLVKSLWAGFRFGVSVVGLVAEHGVKDVAVSSGQADEGGVVVLAFGAFAVVVGPAGGVFEGGERGEEERAFEFAVAGSGGVFAPLIEDSEVGVTGGDAGVGGQVGGGGEVRGVADFEEDAGCGPGPDAGHGGQDPGKRVCIKDLLGLFGDLFSLLDNGFQVVGETREHGVGGGGAGNSDGLLVQGGPDRVDRLLAHPGCVLGRD